MPGVAAAAMEKVVDISPENNVAFGWRLQKIYPAAERKNRAPAANAIRSKEYSVTVGFEAFAMY